MPRYLFLAFFAALAFFSPASWAQDDGPTAYPVKSLNAGLGPAPEDVDRETPRIAMETFLHFAEREDWAAAAHSLNLNGLDPAEQAERGPDLARKLDMVIARKAIIDWSTLLDRPDAIDAEATDRMAMAGTPRKSLLLWQLDLGRHPASIRLNRVDPPDGDPVWVFSEQTVDNIDPLYAEYGPSAFEELLPDYWREETSLGLLRWELLGLPVLVIAAIGAGMLMRRLLDFLSRWIRWRVTSDIFRAIRGPAIFGAVTAVV